MSHGSKYLIYSVAEVCIVCNYISLEGERDDGGRIYLKLKRQDVVMSIYSFLVSDK